MAFLASIALSVVLSAQVATTSAAPAADLASLIARLGADETADRDAAQQAILALPGDPTAELRAARVRAADPDVRMRIDAMLVQSRERAELGPSRVTLKFDDAPLSKVIDELERQSHARFNDIGPEFGDQQPRVTIDARDVTFWDAIARVQAAGNVVFQPTGGNDGGWRVSRNFGQMNAVRGIESGAFLFQPIAASYSRTISYAANNAADRESFNLQLLMLAEPKIRLGEQPAQVVLDRARDANGNDLLPVARNPMMAGVGQNQVNCSIQLAYPKQPADTIAEISGVLRLAIANRVVSIESDDLFGGGRIEKQLEGMRITIEPATPGDDNNNNAPAGRNGRAQPSGDGRIELNVTVERGNANGSPVADQIQRALLRARVTDPSGRAMQQAGFGNASSDATRQTFRVLFAAPQPLPRRADGTAAPVEGTYKLRIDVPVGFRPVEVPFTFRDLKMP